jgi:hypothetical protein
MKQSSNGARRQRLDCFVASLLAMTEPMAVSSGNRSAETGFLRIEIALDPPFTLCDGYASAGALFL